MKVTETVTRVATILSGDGPDNSFFSVAPIEGSDGIELVIGARWDDRMAARFSKPGLADLIAMLQEIHDAMKD